jgi:hypothetical protein
MVERSTNLVIGSHKLCLVINVLAFPFSTHNDPVLSPFEMLQGNLMSTLFRGLNRRLANVIERYIETLAS